MSDRLDDPADEMSDRLDDPADEMSDRLDDPVIEARALTKRYGDFVAVDHLDLAIAPGEIFGLLGPNGAGKTTTILMLLGLTERSEGDAIVLGLDPARNPLAVKRRVGYLPDNVGFYGTMTGRENLRYTARLNGLAREHTEARIDELLAEVGLSGAADARVDTYSRGMRQRLGIADALVKDPRVVILDEPTIGIDPEGVAEVLALVRALADDHGVTVMLSSHLLHQVQSVCDRVGIFVGGRLVAEGTTRELAAQMRGPETTLELGVDADREVQETLRRIAAVTSVERAPGGRGVWLVRATEDVRDEVVRALLDAGIGLRYLSAQEEELDEIYRRYFAGQRDQDVA